ncbi:hypothetical protein E2C01_060974 [Portunus trituberculatus]|uniref:Uncharacterized protein n=1 Tax=Portunus trituberculatus TaxID=210409 RepID=A0A5B7H410_PORTR|nr:hypothetical protein [Portunus trituberculatus]
MHGPPPATAAAAATATAAAAAAAAAATAGRTRTRVRLYGSGVMVVVVVLLLLLLLLLLMRFGGRRTGVVARHSLTGYVKRTLPPWTPEQCGDALSCVRPFRNVSDHDGVRKLPACLAVVSGGVDVLPAVPRRHTCLSSHCGAAPCRKIQFTPSCRGLLAAFFSAAVLDKPGRCVVQDRRRAGPPGYGRGLTTDLWGLRDAGGLPGIQAQVEGKEFYSPAVSQAAQGHHRQIGVATFLTASSSCGPVVVAAVRCVEAAVAGGAAHWPGSYRPVVPNLS